MILEICLTLFIIALYLGITFGCLLSFEIIGDGLDFGGITTVIGGICLLILMLGCGLMLTSIILECI